MHEPQTRKLETHAHTPGEALNAERHNALRVGLPPELQQLHMVDSGHDNATVGVHYLDGELVLRVGRNATARNIEYHAATAKQLLRYQGPLGLVRRVLNLVASKLGLAQAYGSRGFEAQLEVRKLRSIEAKLWQLRSKLEFGAAMTDFGERVSAGKIDAELVEIQAQLVAHEANLNRYEPGKGVIEAQSKSTVDDYLDPPPTSAEISQAKDQAKVAAQRPIDEHALRIKTVSPRSEREMLLAIKNGEMPRFVARVGSKNARGTFARPDRSIIWPCAASRTWRKSAATSSPRR